MHRLDYPQIAESVAAAAAWYGHEVTPPREPDRFIEHGDTIEVGSHSIAALHCPGHTPGSLCLYAEGMVLTAGSGDDEIYLICPDFGSQAGMRVR